jgi:hypothetical protein
MRRTGLVFQERGGPRSVSGEPIEEIMITESDGTGRLRDARRSGVEISNAWKSTNWSWTKVRMPHLPGNDFKT